MTQPANEPHLHLADGPGPTDTEPPTPQPIVEFFEHIAQQLGLGPSSGEQTLELRYEDGNFRWARIHSGRLGRDHPSLATSDPHA